MKVKIKEAAEVKPYGGEEKDLCISILKSRSRVIIMLRQRGHMAFMSLFRF